MAASIYNGISLGKIHDITKIDMWFLTRIENIVNMEKTLMTGACDRDTLLEAKRLGFTDDVIAMMSAFPRRQSKISAECGISLRHSR